MQHKPCHRRCFCLASPSARDRHSDPFLLRPLSQNYSALFSAPAPPVAFCRATVLAGFTLARFVKSSADNARGTGGGNAAASGHAVSGHYAASGGSVAPAPGTSTAGAPGWVPASSGGQDDADPTRRRPATTAAASLGGAAAHHGGAGHPGPGRSS